MFSKMISMAGGVMLCGWLLVGNSQGAALPRFDGQRAMASLSHQCALGPRNPGSPGNLLLRKEIVSQAESLGLVVRTQVFSAEMALGTSPVELGNVVVSCGPEGGQRLWLAAHFDTRPVCDQDPDPQARQQPLTGANDGASGVAVLLVMMELMAAQPPAQGVDLLFLDGEDSGVSEQTGSFCIGSQHLAETLGEFGNPLDGRHCRGLILLDMIGDRHLSIPMERYSLANAPDWTEMVFQRAAELSLPAFRREPGPSIYDDHVPFLQQGIPAVDLIDFDYPVWHTAGDVPAACSAGSLEQVGRLLVDLVYRP